MGSSASKASRAAGTAARQYPTRAPPTSHPTPSTAPTNAPPYPPPPAPNRTPGPTVRPQPRATSTRSEEINLDASDPNFARSLRSMGAVQPNPTMSQTSTFPHPSQAPGPNARTNPAIAVLEARARLQEEAEREFTEAGRRGHPGREFLDVYTVRQMLVLRDGKRQGAGEIEKALGLRKGTVERLGAPGVVGIAQDVGS